MTRRPARRRLAATVAGVLVASALALSGCTGAEPSPSPSSGARTPAQTNGPSPSPTMAPEAVLVPEGSAADNLPFFTLIADGVWATELRDQGRAYVDALTAAGFDKAAMQVTPDTSTVGNPAESIQFSVLWKGECLVGQVGPATGDPVTVVARALEGGTCLIGNTRPIDW